MRRVALGAFAAGATAVGALAVGALAVRRARSPGSSATVAADELAIRSTIERWQEAVRAKDLDRVMAHYAPDFRAFDIAPPLQSRGLTSWRAGMEMWFESWSGPLGIDIHDLEIEVDGDVAYSTGITHLEGIRTSGEKTDMWLRATVGWRRRNGEWLVTHEHVSVPLLMDGSNRAAVDLRP